MKVKAGPARRSSGGRVRHPTWRNLPEVLKAAGLAGIAMQITALLKGAWVDVGMAWAAADGIVCLT